MRVFKVTTNGNGYTVTIEAYDNNEFIEDIFMQGEDAAAFLKEYNACDDYIPELVDTMRDAVCEMYFDI